MTDSQKTQAGAIFLAFLLAAVYSIGIGCGESKPPSDIVLPEGFSVGEISVDFPDAVTMDKVTTPVKVIVIPLTDLSLEMTSYRITGDRVKNADLERDAASLWYNWSILARSLTTLLIM